MKIPVLILSFWIGCCVEAPGAEEITWWSLKPLSSPSIPRVQHVGLVRNPIDGFLLQKLEAANLSFNPAAEKITLLRRLSFDLTGLPPGAEEIRAFLNDPSPLAYEKVVDRLLGSPRYGERWARHWMDLVHFAETHGNDQDRPRTNAWPYRDYLIDAFNSDKPYARFVQEQIAGDVLFPGEADAIIATGFIASGPWDESSLMAIVDDTVDKKIAQNLDRDDMVMTAMSTFTSSTVHCARCHNHKFDPITQQEYYSLQSVFAGVDRADREFDRDPAVGRMRKYLRKAKENPPTPADRIELAAAIESWSRKVTSQSSGWISSKPGTLHSVSNSIFTINADNSVLASGTRPEKDIYSIEISSPMVTPTGLRLEVLSDEKLPQRGPGRQDNGNLHLSEIHVSVRDPNSLNGWSAVTLVNPTADFNQDGWSIAMAIDGSQKTAWGIYPQVGKNHTAIFEFSKLPPGAKEFRIDLDQNHGGGHLIGRFRISFTDSPPPLKASTLPDHVIAALKISEEQRTSEQREVLARYYWPMFIDEKLARLPAPEKVYAATKDFVAEANFKPAKTPRPVFMLRRGDINNPIEPVRPAALKCVPGLSPEFTLTHDQEEGERRAALAAWLTSPRNVLTWRSIANRIWQHHFGKGIVETPNDFGRMGGQPSHPELLDWLASYLQAHQGSIKALHKLIVTSAAYRQSSTHNPRAASVDSDNRLVWRMPREKLDAESTRDALLFLTGSLDLKMGGPSVKQFLQSPGIHVTPRVDYEHVDVDAPEFHRRSVYRFSFRTLPDPFMDSLDCADASQLTPARNQSFTALQALALLNNQFMVRYSEHLAAQLAKKSPALRAQIDEGYQLLFARDASEQELAELLPYAARHGMANVCRLLLNSNEFIFLN